MSDPVHTDPTTSAGKNAAATDSRQPKPAVFKVPTTGTLTVDIVLCTT